MMYQDTCKKSDRKWDNLASAGGMMVTFIAHSTSSSVGMSCLSVTVTERRLDEKRRVTIPASASSLKQGSKVAMISYDDAVIIASDKALAEELSSFLHESETRRKLKALNEWEDLVEKAGLSNLTAEKIDRAVERGIRRPKKLNV